MDFNPKPVNQPPIEPSIPAEIAHKSFYRANRFYIWAAGFALLVIGVLGYFAFRPAPPPEAKEANVELWLEAPDSLPSGGEAVYYINMRNNDDARLAAVELELAYPEGLAYAGSSPKAVNLSGSAFSVPDLLPGQSATVIVKARTSGDVNAEKTLLAKLYYRYRNFNSPFIKEAAHTLRLTASDVVLEMDGPKETNTAQVVVYVISYKNNSKDTIKNARIRVLYPNGFNYGSSEPAASFGGNVWNVGDLQSLGEGKISLRGTFSGSNSGESKKLVVEFQALGDGGEYFLQNSAETVTQIISQPLLVRVENLDQREGGIVDPGETLNFAVRYQNNANVAASAVNIVITLDSKALDLGSLQAQGGQVIGNTITWNAAGAPNLESLNPSEQGTLNFFIRVKNPATRDSSKALTVNILSKIKASEYSTFLPGGGLELKLSSPIEVQAELVHLSGSLPPKVGTQTRYRARLKLSNSSNDLTDGELTFFLPTAAGAFNKDSVNAGEKNNVEFDPATGKLNWKVGFVPAHSGKFNPAKILEFEIALDPSPADVGSSPELLRNIKLFARDDFTGQEVRESTQDLTTASLLGQNGYASGFVTP